MIDEVITAKLDPPVWMGEQIRRESLLQRLQAVHRHRLTLIQAPAGYGKTSLLAQWRSSLDKQETEVAWLTLERDDRDLKRFISYLMLAIQHGDRQAERATHTVELPPRAALSAIVNLLDSKAGPFVLIFDDLHLAECKPVDEFLQAMIRLAPSHCHFVFASRDYPNLGQSILAAEEQLLEISAHDLRFSAVETESMLARSDTALAASDIDRILERTEGWPIAVQLSSLSLKRGIDRERFIASLSGSSSDLARYLSEQVLMTLPEETREIVMRTALLDRLTGETVDLLCDCDDGWLVLERLEQQGLFLSSESFERNEYRYHQLFAEYLRDRFLRSNRAAYVALQQRLANWFMMRGNVNEAVNHAVMAGEEQLLADIIEQAGGWRLIPGGMQGVLESGLAKLPDATIRNRPRLALAQVYLQLKLGELGQARLEFDRLEENTRSSDLSADLRTEIRVVGDTLLDYENQPISLDDLLEREALLRKLPANDHLVLANISETLGAKYFEGGWLERALQPTLASREHYQAFGSVYSDLFTRFLEGRIKRSQGRSKDASAIFESAWQTILANFGKDSDLAANCAAFQAELLFEQDQPGEARDLLAWALPHMEHSDGWVDVYASAYFTEARALAGEGDFDEAWAVLDRARRTAARRRLRQLELLADLCEFDLRLSNGIGIEEAEEMADRIELDRWADMMAEESPQYRPVVVSASLCRIKLRLLGECHDDALAELAQLRSWANQRGAGRLLIEINLLLAYAQRQSGALAEARTSFDDAVGTAMFQDLARPFVELRQFVLPCLDDAIASDQEVDRLRANFLKSLARSLAAFRNKPTLQGLFNQAEAEVLYYLSQGHSNKEIARLIGMSPDTVKYRLKSLFRKVGASKRADAVRIAAERGLIPTTPPTAGRT